MKYRAWFIFLPLVSIICIFSNFSLSSGEGPHPYILRYPGSFGRPNILPENPLTVEGIWLGRLLFYDTLLSAGGRVSCASCHRQELSFTDGRRVAIGVHGDTLKRNTMSLVNVAWGSRFFWDGRVTTLEALVRQPLMNPQEMDVKTEKDLIGQLKAHLYYPTLFRKAFPGQDISVTTISRAIAQFMRTIVSRPHQRPDVDTAYDLNSFLAVKDSVTIKIKALLHSKDSALLTENSALGSIVRVSYMQCNNCHTSDAFHGRIVTADENDSFFKAPTLMNVEYTGPYFHDGRFKTLREVLEFYNDNMEQLEKNNPGLMERPGIRIKFNEYDLEHAGELFSTFSDSTINTNPAFSNPFHQKGFSWYGIKGETRGN